MKVSMSTHSCPKGPGPCLKEKDLHFWFDSLLRDDVETVEKHMNQLGILRQNEFLDGHVCMAMDGKLDKLKGLKLGPLRAVTYSTLWCITVSFGAERITEFCLQRGVDVMITDKNGDNAFHALISVSAMLKIEMLSCLKLLKAKLEPEQLKELLHQENNSGYRPLELAMNAGCLQLYKEIFQTEDVYLTHRDQFAAFESHFFDITEYESYTVKRNRQLKSPLWYFAHLDESVLDNTSGINQFSGIPMKVWCDLKMKSARPLIIVWFVLRLIFSTFLSLFNALGGLLEPTERQNIKKILNGSLSVNESDCIEAHHSQVPAILHSSSFILAIQGVVFLYALMVIIFDSVEWVVWVRSGFAKRCMATLNGSKNLICNGYRFRTFQILIAISCIFLLAGVTSDMEIMANIAYASLMTSVLWSLFYFMQLLPWIGPMIINIERLFSEVIGFSLIFILFTLPMGYILNDLEHQTLIGPCTDSINADAFSIFYKAFLIMVNIVNFEKPLSENTSLQLYHVSFVFIVSVLLLNFLIASFSNILTTQIKNQETVNYIQRLHIAMMCEQRVGAVLPGLVHWLHKRYFQYCPDTETFYINSIAPRNYSHSVVSDKKKAAQALEKQMYCLSCRTDKSSTAKENL